MRIDPSGIGVDANHSGLDAVDVAERAPEIPREERRAEALLRGIRELDRVIEIGRRE